MRVDGAAPRGFLRFLSLTALRAEGCGGGSAADYKKRGAADAAGCVEGLRRYRSGGDSACGAEGDGLPSRAMLIKSALRDLLLVSYVMISTTVISHLRWLSPLWCLTAPPSPRGIGRATKGKRLYGQARRLTSPDLHIQCRMCTVDNKAPRGNLPICDSIVSTGL